jgi:hypothetical protein
MKFVITFILCFCFNSYETAAIYEVGQHGVLTTHPTVTTPKKLTFKERVVLKYLKLKAAKTTKKTRFFIAAIIFLAAGIFLTISARQSNQAVPRNGFTGSNEGCLKAVFALLSYATSLILFIVALVTSV